MSSLRGRQKGSPFLVSPKEGCDITFSSSYFFSYNMICSCRDKLHFSPAPTNAGLSAAAGGCKPCTRGPGGRWQPRRATKRRKNANACCEEHISHVGALADGCTSASQAAAVASAASKTSSFVLLDSDVSKRRSRSSKRSSITFWRSSELSTSTELARYRMLASMGSLGSQSLISAMHHYHRALTSREQF